MRTNNDLARHLVAERSVQGGSHLLMAFEAVDRKDFVPEELRTSAYDNCSLPIGWGQTISQPSTVAFMLGLLGVMPGNRVLDVGSGSGYTTALLSVLVGQEGSVWGIDCIPQLVEQSKRNLKKYSFHNIHLVSGKIEGNTQLPTHSFDRILVSASAPEVPPAILEKLALNGVLVIPVGHQMMRICKIGSNQYTEEKFGSFSFVPYV